MDFRRFNSQFLLSGTAVFAGLWAVARACAQSVTIDEADTYLHWVARVSPAHWEAASNNHVLNSLLMRLFTSVFGLSHLSVRAPALIGAALYIAAAYGFCRIMTRSLTLQWPLFVCLVYNPFVFDHLVAARGYSLALAFLMVTLFIAAFAQLEELRGRPWWPPANVCAACSVCAALSFAGNFSFAIVDAAAIIAILVGFCRGAHDIRTRAGLLAACTLPGLLVTLLLTAPVVLHFPKAELRYGAESLGEMLSGIVGDSLYQLNPQIVNPLLLHGVEPLNRLLFPFLLAAAIWRLVAIVRLPAVPAGLYASPHDKWLRAFAKVLLATLVISLLAHWLAFRLFHVLLPKDRTAIFFVPLCTLLIAIAAAFPIHPASEYARRALTIMLFAVSFYFLGCLRLSYFKEWQWDADVRKVYGVLAYYNRAYGIRDVVSEWKYGSALNFYRLLSGHETIAEIRSPLRIPADAGVFVLDWDFEEDFIKQQGLRVVYRAETTDVVVAIRPQVEGRAEGRVEAEVWRKALH